MKSVYLNITIACSANEKFFVRIKRQTFDSRLMRLESMPLLSLSYVEYVDVAFLSAANQQLMLRRQDQRAGSLLVTHET